MRQLWFVLYLNILNLVLFSFRFFSDYLGLPVDIFLLEYWFLRINQLVLLVSLFLLAHALLADSSGVSAFSPNTIIFRKIGVVILSLFCLEFAWTIFWFFFLERLDPLQIVPSAVIWLGIAYNFLWVAGRGILLLLFCTLVLEPRISYLRFSGILYLVSSILLSLVVILEFYFDLNIGISFSFLKIMGLIVSFFYVVLLHALANYFSKISSTVQVRDPQKPVRPYDV